MFSLILSLHTCSLCARIHGDFIIGITLPPTNISARLTFGSACGVVLLVFPQYTSLVANAHRLILRPQPKHVSARLTSFNCGSVVSLVHFFIRERSSSFNATTMTETCYSARFYLIQLW